jgi:hypothetical protein
VVGFGGDVASEIVESVERHHDRLTDRGVSDDLFMILVEAKQFLKHERPLDGSQLERHFLAGLDVFLGWHNVVFVFSGAAIAAFYRVLSHAGRIETSTNQRRKRGQTL